MKTTFDNVDEDRINMRKLIHDFGELIKNAK